MRVSESATLGPKGTEERLRVQNDQCVTQTPQVFLSWSRPTSQFKTLIIIRFWELKKKNVRLSLASVYKSHIDGRIKCPSALTILVATAETQVRAAGPPSQPNASRALGRWWLGQRNEGRQKKSHRSYCKINASA